MVEVHLIALLVASIGYYLALAGILLRIIVSNEKEDLVERELIPPAKRRRELARREVMYELMDEQICHKNLRMSPNAFKNLCELLRGTGLIRDNQYSYVEEQVSKCLHVLAHGTRCSLSSLLYRRSSETVSRHFHQVLRAIISLEDRFFIQPDGTSVPYEIKYSGGRFSPYFENCVGAIDGTHIRVKVKNKDVSRYRGRKLVPTMNVLAACTFDLRFTYVLPGWEGSASDSRILDDALRREDKLIVPQGKYYLVDAGYMLRSGFLTPYRNTHYHLKEYSHHYPPSTPQELFNLRHSSLRIAVERAFGVLKNRFPIIGSGEKPRFNSKTTSEMIITCCILHNYLLGVDPDASILEKVDESIRNSDLSYEEYIGVSRDVDGKKGELLRESIAAQMWHDYSKK